MSKYQPYMNGASIQYVTGTSLAQFVRNMSPAARAILAADILEGRVVVTGLTRQTVTTLCGANASYVAAALRCTPEQRAAVKRGERALIRARGRAPTPAPGNGRHIDDATLARLARAVGVERLLDAAVEAERATS
jgi:hypothetical protein